MYFLHTVFGHRLISHQYSKCYKCEHFWPHLNLCDFSCGISWERNWSQRNHVTSWAWQKWLSRCAGDFWTYVNILQTQVHFPNMVVILNICLTEDISQEVCIRVFKLCNTWYFNYFWNIFMYQHFVYQPLCYWLFDDTVLYQLQKICTIIYLLIC